MLQCLACGYGFVDLEIDWDNDRAVCLRCSRSYRPSELLGRAPLPVGDLAKPPQGCAFSRDQNGFLAAASSRSAEAIWLLPAFAVMAGLGWWLLKGGLRVSFFGGAVLALAALRYAGPALMSLAGRVELGKQGDAGWVFAGVGPVGWTRRFSWAMVAASCTSESFLHGVRRPTLAATLRMWHGEPLRFGTTLTPERRAFMVRAAKEGISAPPTAAPGPPAVPRSPAGSAPESPPAVP